MGNLHSCRIAEKYKSTGLKKEKIPDKLVMATAQASSAGIGQLQIAAGILQLSLKPGLEKALV